MALARVQTRRATPPVADIEERIRQRAFELFESRGREDGHDLDDWLQAEAEIKGTTRRLANLKIVS